MTPQSRASAKARATEPVPARWQRWLDNLIDQRPCLVDGRAQRAGEQIQLVLDCEWDRNVQGLERLGVRHLPRIAGRTGHEVAPYVWRHERQMGALAAPIDAAGFVNERQRRTPQKRRIMRKQLTQQRRTNRREVG